MLYIKRIINNAWLIVQNINIQARQWFKFTLECCLLTLRYYELKSQGLKLYNITFSVNPCPHKDATQYNLSWFVDGISLMYLSKKQVTCRAMLKHIIKYAILPGNEGGGGD